MPTIVNPFDAGGYSVAEMTDTINIVPTRYNRLTELGLFDREGIPSETVLVEYDNGTVNLLPSRLRGEPASVANRDRAALRAFVIPHIPHNDLITTRDLQGIRYGYAEATPIQLATLMNKRLTRMRAKHELTYEYMAINALQGILKDGAGVTIYNFFDQFNETQVEVDFVLGTAGTDVAAKARQVIDAIEDNLKGEVMTDVHALVDRTFFAALIGHATVKEAYKYYATTNGENPLRDGMRRAFPFGGIMWESYNGRATLSDGTTSAPFLPTKGGVAFPLGTMDTYKTYDGPPDFMETVNTPGVPFYARQYAKDDGKGVQVQTESNPFPITRRPKLSVKVTSSN